MVPLAIVAFLAEGNKIPMSDNETAAYEGSGSECDVERFVTTFSLSEEQVREVAAKIAASGVEPTDAAVRDYVYDTVEVSPEFRANGLPVSAAVREQLPVSSSD